MLAPSTLLLHIYVQVLSYFHLKNLSKQWSLCSNVHKHPSKDTNTNCQIHLGTSKINSTTTKQ